MNLYIIININMLPKSIVSIIALYTSKYTDFVNWIDVKQINYIYLSCNPNAVHILEKNINQVNWNILSYNPNAIHILEKNLDKVNWYSLSGNPNAIHLLEKNLSKLTGSR